MKRIPKDLADKMVEDVLTAISKQTDVSSQFAEDSLRIMQNNTDNTIFTGILLTKARPSLFDDNEIDMKLTIMSALQTVFMCGMNKEIGFNKKLAKEFSSLDKTKCADSTKLDFALNQFVNAFYEYERLENKYPELMKIM
jgi:hypothetical protein